MPEYAPWRKLTDGDGPLVIAVGPLAGTYLESFEAVPKARRPTLWAVAELPIERNPVPAELLHDIQTSALLCVAEEHVRRGSFGSELAHHLMELGVYPARFRHLYAQAHLFNRYGSQKFLRAASISLVRIGRDALQMSTWPSQNFVKAPVVPEMVIAKSTAPLAAFLCSTAAASVIR